MAITYTNITKAVLDSLESICDAEFAPIPVEVAEKYNPDFMNKGEYLRMWMAGESELSKVASGQIGGYDVELVWYFNDLSFNKEKMLDEVISPRIDRLKQLLYNNTSVSSGATWYDLSIDSIQFPIDITVVDDLDLEGLENIKVALMEITISRGDFS